MEGLFEIQNCETYGNYIVAGRDFEEGQVIFHEEPIFSAPDDGKLMNEKEFCCIGCYKILAEAKITCGICGWPVCREECSKDKLHSTLECALLLERAILPNAKYLSYLKFVRVVLMKNLYPDRYEKIFSLAFDFGDKWSVFHKIVSANSKEVWEFLTSICHLTITYKDVIHLWSVLKINSFCITWDKEDDILWHRGRALFDVCSKFVHSCYPNLEWACVKVPVDGVVGWEIQLSTRSKISKGDILSITYSVDGLNYGTGFRRTYFQAGFPFSCRCPRCADATEGGTYFSSHKCPICTKGNMLPSDPLNSLKCWWSCTMPTCNFMEEGEEIEEDLDEPEKFVRTLTLTQTAVDETLDQLDFFIDTHSGKTLHENHFLIYQSILYWLQKGSFSKILIEKSESSDKLYKKILERSYRCLRLSRLILNSAELITLELVVADCIAAFGFKTPNCSTIPAEFHDIRMNNRFSKAILCHVSEARKWAHIQPRSKIAENQKTDLDELYLKWSDHCCLISQQLTTKSNDMLEVALSQINSLFV